MSQLELFATTRHPGTGHPTLTGIDAAGWHTHGQFQWDARRWIQGLEPTIVDEAPRRQRFDQFQLTETQIAYLKGPR